MQEKQLNLQSLVNSDTKPNNNNTPNNNISRNEANATGLQSGGAGKVQTQISALSHHLRSGDNNDGAVTPNSISNVEEVRHPLMDLLNHDEIILEDIAIASKMEVRV